MVNKKAGRLRRRGAIFGAISIVSAIGIGHSPAQAAPANSPLIVDSIGDSPDSDPTDGRCAAADGACTLRAAITQANASNGNDTIHFAIPGNGRQQIKLTSPLPTFDDSTGGVTVDGYTQPGATPNTSSQGSNASIVIEVNASGKQTGFAIQSTANTIRGISVYGAAKNISLQNDQADRNKIVGNFIGTNAAGTFQDTRGVGEGISFNLGPDQNTVGTPNLADRNVISGNGAWGVRINHGETSQNVFQNNIIGLNPAGDSNLTQRGGIDIQWWTWGNLVGGNNPGEGNVISGNSALGIDLSHSSQNNLIIGNYIGTTVDGNSSASYTGNGKGIAFKDNPTENYVAQNIISGNGDGIWHKHNYTGKNTFVQNRIGVGSNGAAIGNSNYGVYLTGHNDLYFENTISNNTAGGVYITNLSAVDNHTNYPQERTAYNSLRQNMFYGNTGLDIDIYPVGPNSNDPGDRDTGAHDLLNTPEISGLGPAAINGTACAGCSVEIYVSGTTNADGTLSAPGSTGRVWVGTVEADASGVFSMGDTALSAGASVSALAINAAGDTSEFSPTQTIPATGSGLQGDHGASNGGISAPSGPARPPSQSGN